jgi:fluoroacetyl-CoA thioesterase
VTTDQADQAGGSPTTGLSAVIEERVTDDMTAAAVGSGDVPVLATPAVLALVERAAVESLRDHLPAGSTTVGASVGLAHLAPTSTGARVRAEVLLDQVDGRRLRFRFTVTDGAGEVANGTHVRVLVDRKRFESEARSRAHRKEPAG